MPNSFTYKDSSSVMLHSDVIRSEIFCLKVSTKQAVKRGALFSGSVIAKPYFSVTHRDVGPDGG